MLDYFKEHGRIQKAIQLLADEMDYLGLYLETSFNIWQAESEGWTLALTGMSRSIDNYYNSRAAGITVPKPKPKLSPYFSRLIARLEERRPPGWITVGHLIMRACSFDEQRKVERMLERLKKNVLLNWRYPEHECSLSVTPPEIRDTVIVFHAFPPQLSSKRREIARELAEQVLEDSGRKRCIVISRSTDEWDDTAYASVLIAVAKEEEGATSSIRPVRSK